jgi:hypothetical protein
MIRTLISPQILIARSNFSEFGARARAGGRGRNSAPLLAFRPSRGGRRARSSGAIWACSPAMALSVSSPDEGREREAVAIVREGERIGLDGTHGGHSGSA